jgi:multiple sugar transport system substrate-binding protein
MYEGKTYGVPAIENAPRLSLGWNKTLFKAAGLDPEKPPTTLDELAAFAEKLTKYDANKNLIQVGFDPLDAMGGGQALNTWARAFGANWYDPKAQKVYLDTPEMAAMVDYVTSFYKKYGPEKIAAFRQSYRQWSGAPEAAFPRGVEAMILEGYWAPGELKVTAQPGNVYGFTWMPTKTGEKIQIVGGWNVCIPKGAKHVEEAFKFIEFLSTDDANLTILEMAGSFCATKSFATKTDFTKYGGLAWFMESVTKADKVYGTVLCPVFAEAKSRLLKGFDEVSFGRKTTKEMLAELQKAVQDALDKAVGK